MPTDKIPVHVQLTSTEMKIFDLALEEEGLDPADPDAPTDLLLAATRRVAARAKAPASSRPDLPTAREKLDELVLLCFANGRSRPPGSCPEHGSCPTTT